MENERNSGKKGFLSRLMDKLDKKLEGAAKKKGCSCCCSDKKKEGR